MRKTKIHLTIESKIISYEGTMYQSKALTLLKSIKRIQQQEHIEYICKPLFNNPPQIVTYPNNHPIKVTIKPISNETNKETNRSS